MQSTFLAAWAALATFSVGLAIAARRWPRAAALVAVGTLALFPFVSDTSDWNSWFDWVKRYSIMGPTAVWAMLHAWPERRASRLAKRAMPWLLLLNMLEAALLEWLVGSRVNAVVVALVGLLVPLRWSDAPGMPFGFRSTLVPAAMFVSLGRLYWLNPTFGNSTCQALTALSIATLATAAARDSQVWMHWRVWPLWVCVVQDSIVPSASVLLYPPLFQRANRLPWIGSVPDRLAQLAGVALVGAMAAQWMHARWRARERGSYRPTAPRGQSESALATESPTTISKTLGP